MRKSLLALLLFLGSLAFAQNPGVVIVGVAPSGACPEGTPGRLVNSTGAIWTCQNIVAGVGTWAQISGGGTSGIISINSDTTPAQVISGSSPITASTTGGTTTVACPTCGTSTIAVAGSSGDLQTNNGSANLGAAHINDNATTMTVTESITPLVAAAKNLGTAPLPFGDGYFGGAANHSFHFDTSAVASNVAVAVPNHASNTVQGIADPSDTEAINFISTDGVQHRISVSSLSVAGSSGDLQMNGGSSNLAAAHVNDNGSAIYFSEPTSFYLATAGSGGVTQNLLAAVDASSPSKFVLPASGNCGVGFALTSASANGTFLLGSSVQEDYIGIADNGVTAGHILVGGTAVPGRVKDSAATQLTGVPVGTCVVGKALTTATIGNPVTVIYMGLGTFGTSGQATYTGTPTINVLAKFTGSAGQVENSSVVDDATNPTQTPNGVDTSLNGVSHTIPNASSGGTARYYTVCRDSSGNGSKCPSNTIVGMEGVATVGVGTAPGTTGSVSVCATTGCLGIFDNQTTIGHWAIASATAGKLSDNGSTTQTVGKQSWYITSANTYPGSPNATFDVLSGNVVSQGGGTPPGNVFGPASATSGDVASFNGTTGKLIQDASVVAADILTYHTPATGVALTTSGSQAVTVIAPSGTKCYPYQGSGGTGCDSPGGGITSITGPPDLSTWTIVGSVATQGKANAPTNAVWSGPPASGLLTPVVRQTKACFTPSGGLVATCAFDAATKAGNLIFVATLANSYTGYGCPSGVQGHISALALSDGTNSYTTIDFYDDTSAAYQEDGYASNIAGGAVTVTVTATAPGGTSACFGTMITELSNVDPSPLDQHGISRIQVFSTLTNSAANDIILGAAIDFGQFGPYTFTALPGWPLVILSANSSTVGMSVAEVSQVGVDIGTYTPVIADSNFGLDYWLKFTASFKAATSGGGSQPWASQYISQEMMTKSVWPNLAGVVPAGTATGDTGMSQHVGTHILSNDRTTAYAGNDSDSTLHLTVVASGYTCHVGIKCNTAVSTATVIPSIIYTSDDSASTVETITGGTAACTTLGTADTVSMVQEIHAKAATTIYLLTTLLNSPHYNTDAFCEVHTEQ